MKKLLFGLGFVALGYVLHTEPSKRVMSFAKKKAREGYDRFMDYVNRETDLSDTPDTPDPCKEEVKEA